MAKLLSQTPQYNLQSDTEEVNILTYILQVKKENQAQRKQLAKDPG